MDSSKFLAFCITLWCFDLVEETYSLENALLFKYEDKKLAEMKPDDKYAKSFHCITACPSSPNSEEEGIINEYASIAGNGIFLRDVYRGSIDEKIKINICNKRPAPATVWNKSMEWFEIGYELFYEAGKIDLPCWDYDKYVRIVDGKPAENDQEVQSEEYKGSFSFQITSKNNENLKPKFVFYWIEVLSITEFNPERYRIIRFTKDAINDNYSEQAPKISRCKNYYSGDQRDKPVIDENREILGYEEYETFDKNQDTLGTEIENHLEKTQIIPTHMFHTYSARLATCSYLNMTFIWNTIANQQLKKVDLFLYAFYRVWPAEVSITFGVAGKSSGISPDKLKEIESENKLFSQYPIPEIIFRIVEYRLKNEIYEAVVVIHNDVHYTIPPKRLCRNKNQIVEGWGEIHNSANTIPGKTYVCRLTKGIYQKLGINVETSLLPKSKDLRLDQLPHVKDKEENIGYGDVTNIVQQEFERIKNPNMPIENFNSEYVSKMISDMKSGPENLA